MSLDDPVFDGMFHGDGSVRVPGKCVQCAEETSDVEEDLCRTCLPDMHQSGVVGGSVGPTSGEVESMGVLLAAAAASPVTTPRTLDGTLTTPPLPLPTVSGVPSLHIPMLDAFAAFGSPPERIASPVGVQARKPKKLTQAQADQKKLTDKACQLRRKGRMRALQDANRAQVVQIKTLQKNVDSLKASLQKSVGGRNNANATTRGGLHEHLLITRYEQWQAVKFALDRAYCAPNSTVALRTFFQDETGNVKVVGRFMWNPVGSELFGGLGPLQAYADHLLEAGSGRLLFRSEGKYGRGMQILDSGDCESAEAAGECNRTFLHRDWDNNRLNSLTIILALANDVMGYVVRNDNGELEEKIVTMEPGDMHIFPTSVYHFGCSHADYNNTIEGMQGQTQSSLRRRVFCYMDWDSTVRDEEGYVDSAKECPVPMDYNLKTVRGIPDASVAFTYLSSPMLEGRTMQFENTKLIGQALAQAPRGKRQRTSRQGT